MRDPILLPLPVPFSIRVVNSYLLLGDPLTLVDPGSEWPETKEELDSALSTHGLAVEDVEQIVLTHQHLDHVGLAAYVQERSGARVVAHELLVDYLADLPASMEAEDQYQASVMRLHGVAEDVIQELYDVSARHRKHGRSVTVDVPVAEGDRFEAGGREYVVHERPGHSPTDTLFVAADGRFGLAGDHLIATVSSNPVVHQPLRVPADPRKRMRALVAYIASRRQTATLDLEVLYAGHGPVVTGHDRLVGERIAFHDRRKHRIHDAVQRGSRTVREIAIDVWGEVARREAFLTMSEALGHLDLLEDEGRVTVGDDGDVLRYEPS
jgi:glyoxylase-like metal-dependent hydrolase (beta-lactamase superfamily II)